MDSDQELRSLRRGLVALTLINQVEAMSIARLASALGLPRTSAERILNTLAADGYLERSPVDKQYRLTPKVLALSSGFSGESWITHVAAPLLNRTTEEIGWPLALAIPEGADMHLRYTTDTMTSLWLNRRRVGSTIPITRASSGIVFLAFAPPAQGVEMRAVMRERYPDAVLDEAMVAQARIDGFAFSPNDTREQSVSLPIFLDGKIFAVLLMMFMSRVHTHAAVVQKYVPRLRALAATVTERVSTEAPSTAARAAD